MIVICQCDCHPRNPSGIQNGTFRRVLFLFSDRCLLRTLPWKENNGEEHCSCSRFTTIRSKAKQENKIVTCVTLCEPVHGVQWVAVVYVQYMRKGQLTGVCLGAYNSEDGGGLFWLTLYPNHHHPPPTLPLLPSHMASITAEWGSEGQRILRSTHARLNDVTPVWKTSTWQRNMSRASIPKLYQHWRRPSQGKISKNWTHMSKNFKEGKGGVKVGAWQRNACKRVLV